MKAVALLLIFLNFSHRTLSQCVHDDQTLLPWSDPNSWNGNSLPGADDVIDITTPILLDISPGVDIGMITVKAGGKLVFKQGQTLELRTGYILLEGGELHIGGEGNCAFTGQATIVLVGGLDTQYTADNFGRKFIGVAANGVLQIHGKDKDSWTKLDGTVTAVQESAFITRMKFDRNDRFTGLVAYRFNATSGTPSDPEKTLFTDIRSDNQDRIYRGIKQIKAYIQATPDGEILALAVKRSMFHKNAKTLALDYEPLFLFLENILYNDQKRTPLRQAGYYDSWSMVLKKGSPDQGMEFYDAYKDAGRHQTSVSFVVENGMKFEAISYTNSRNHGQSYAVFEVSDATVTSPVLNLATPVNWEAGDRVLISSTDYDWRQQEEAEVVSCDSCGANQIRVNWTPRNTHFGQIYKNVDMRADVALLTRNIKIRSDTLGGDDNGGHIKATKDFAIFKMDNVELSEMGQSDDVGKYPVHWHMAGDVTGTYARKLSIRNSYARCITVHGTRGVELSDNVCVESKGHGYFLEDGDEGDTVFLRNFGTGQKRGNLIRTDRTPATFWLTTPNITLVGNSAGGSDGYGYWFMIPNRPIGHSANVTNLQPKQALQTPIREFDNNVAHSNGMSGLRIMEGQSSTGGRSFGLVYNPLSDPLNSRSTPAKASFSRLTAFKNRKRNVEIRGGWIELVQASSSDSEKSVVMTSHYLRDTETVPILRESVVIGDSPNLGKPCVVTINGTQQTFYRSLPQTTAPRRMRIGVETFWKRTDRRNVYFDGFNGSSIYEATSVLVRNSGRRSSLYENVDGSLFGFNDGNQGSRLRFMKSAMRVDTESEMLLDDGSLTGIPGARIVRNNPFFSTEKCTYSADWNMTICAENFARVYFGYSGRKNSHNATMVRSDGVQRTTTMYDLAPFNVITGSSMIYLAKLPNNQAGSFAMVYTAGIDKNNPIVLAMCVPKGSTATARQFNYGKMLARSAAANTLNDVINDSEGNLYFYDANVGAIFVKLMSHQSYTPGSMESCPAGGKCPKVRFSFSGGNRQNQDCETDFLATYGNMASKRIFSGYARQHKRALTLNVPAALASPPQEFGAGDTMVMSVQK